METNRRVQFEALDVPTDHHSYLIVLNSALQMVQKLRRLKHRFGESQPSFQIKREWSEQSKSGAGDSDRPGDETDRI